MRCAMMRKKNMRKRTEKYEENYLTAMNNDNDGND